MLIIITMLIIIIIISMVIIINTDNHQVLSLVSPLRLLLLPDDWKQLEGHVGAREDTPIFIYNSRCPYLSYSFSHIRLQLEVPPRRIHRVISTTWGASLAVSYSSAIEMQLRCNSSNSIVFKVCDASPGKPEERQWWGNKWGRGSPCHWHAWH